MTDQGPSSAGGSSPGPEEQRVSYYITYCELLGVSPTARLKVIKAAYRARIRAYHLDHNRAPDADEMTALINKTWRVLRDAAGRRLYGATLASAEDAGARQPSDAVSNAVSAERVPWTCARCGRRVPRYVHLCRCGQRRPPPAHRPEAEESSSPTGADVPPDGDELTLAEKAQICVGTVIVLPSVFFVLFAYFLMGPDLDVVATTPSTVVVGQTFTLSLEVSNPLDAATDVWEIEVPGRVARSFRFTATAPRLRWEVDPYGPLFRDPGDEETVAWFPEHVLEPGSSMIIEFAVTPLKPGKHVLEFEVCHGDWNLGYWNWSTLGFSYWNCPRITRVIEVAAR